MLSVTAYKKINPVSVILIDNEPCDPLTKEWVDAVQFWINDEYPGRNNEIQGDLWYSFEDSYQFDSGHTYHLNWCDELARIAGYPEVRVGNQIRCDESVTAGSGPFSELIDFSGCEGTIGPVFCQKLASDFRRFQAQAESHPGNSFRKRYVKWQKAFEMAADSGAVLLR